MTKIRAGVTAANAARATRIDGPLILRVTRVLDQHPAFTGVQAGVARSPRREHAIHHVDSERDVIRDLFRAAHAHEIPRAVSGQERGDFCGHFTRRFMRFTDGQAADRIAGKIEIEKLPGAFAAEIAEGCALYDAELPLGETLPVGAGTRLLQRSSAVAVDV